jgi:inner membrane protein
VPSVLSHPAVPLGIAAAAGRRIIPGGLALLACAASVLPDVDSIGFWAGVPYDSPLGHRGFTHSLTFAALIALLAMPLAGRLRSKRGTVFAVIFVAAASHGLLDAMTTGGRGVAFFSPFSNRRFFLPWRVIEVSPIGVKGFFSGRGGEILASEFAWIWVPAIVAAIVGGIVRGIKREREQG